MQSTDRGCSYPVLAYDRRDDLMPGATASNAGATRCAAGLPQTRVRIPCPVWHMTSVIVRRLPPGCGPTRKMRRYPQPSRG